jgi:hypothetical protein
VFAISRLVIKEKWKEIERLHLNLERLIARRGLQSTEAKWASQALDYKIYEYYQLKSKSFQWLFI